MLRSSTTSVLVLLCLAAACTPLDSGTRPDAGQGDGGADGSASDDFTRDEAGVLDRGDTGVTRSDAGGGHGDAGSEGGTAGPGDTGTPGGGGSENGIGAPCTGEGTLRCDPAGAGARQVCAAGKWAAGEPCATGEICKSDGADAAACRAVAEVCKGSAGAAVCDGQGTLYACNADGTVSSQESCASPRLCQLGLEAKRCAKCVPNTQHHCEGAALQVCAPDGQSFVAKETCPSVALCNEVAGMCTNALCAAGKFACDGDTLTHCNVDGSAFESKTPCMAGKCDAAGGDCNTCDPGYKTCQSDMIMTCDPTGQSLIPSACPNGGHCVGQGNCGACIMDSECSALTQGCKVGACSLSNMCVAQNAPPSTQCTASNGKPGTCSNGNCICTPQCSGKQCGDDGCGGTCRSQCSFSQTCSGTKCVDCTRDSDCADSLDGCKIGVCNSNGTCGTKNAPSTQACYSGFSAGTCRNGSCYVCKSSCATNSCGSDGCGGTCRCGSEQECRDEQCVPKLGAACSPSGTNSAACGSTTSDPRTCFGLASRPPHCAKANEPCPAGTVLFGGGVLSACLYPCTPGNSTFGCPSPLTNCTELYPGVDGSPAYCTR